MKGKGARAVHRPFGVNPVFRWSFRNGPVTSSSTSEDEIDQSITDAGPDFLSELRKIRSCCAHTDAVPHEGPCWFCPEHRGKP